MCIIILSWHTDCCPYVPRYSALTTPAPICSGNGRSAQMGRRSARSSPDLSPRWRCSGACSAFLSTPGTLDDSRPALPRLSLPPRYLAAKWRAAFRRWPGEPIPLPVRRWSPVLAALCDALAEGGAGDSARRTSPRADRRRASRRLAADRVAAARSGGDPHRRRASRACRRIWCGWSRELAVSPFAHALQTQLFVRGTRSSQPRSARWNHGYCPACGSWPALGEGRRRPPHAALLVLRGAPGS